MMKGPLNKTGIGTSASALTSDTKQHATDKIEFENTGNTTLYIGFKTGNSLGKPALADFTSGTPANTIKMLSAPGHQLTYWVDHGGFPDWVPLSEMAVCSDAAGGELAFDWI